MRTGRRRIILHIALAAILLHSTGSSPAATAASTPMPQVRAATSWDCAILNPLDITTGPDGALWFTDPAGAIGRITTAGVVTAFSDPLLELPFMITAGADGNLWFTHLASDAIGKITPAGEISMYTDPSLDQPWGITAGPDGSVWYANLYGSSIGRIEPDGTITDFPIPAEHLPPSGDLNAIDIAAGPDGNLWFTNLGVDWIGRLTPSGDLTTFEDPSIVRPYGIAAGPDGNLWFANQGGDSIGRITTDGVVSSFTAAGLVDPAGIAAGPDGNVWFTNHAGSTIGRITPAGAISLFSGPGIDDPVLITSGPDGNLWFTKNFGNAIGRITPAGVVTTFDARPAGPFTDVPSNHQFCRDIQWLADNDIADGFPDGTFGPTLLTSRQAMAAFLRHALDDSSFTPPTTPTFSDVPPTHTFYADIEWLAANDIAGGFPDGTFGPALPTSRQAMAAFLRHALDDSTFTPPTTPTFSDVPPTHTFYADIEWLADRRITNGFPGGTFEPTQPTSRQAMAAFLHNALVSSTT